MHLTRFTDLSLRVLIYLTHNERKGLVTVTELAERFKWSRNHMVKVVHFMSTKNWVQTHRGRFGGLTLKMHPSEYKIGDIVQILEEQGELIDCFEPHECALAKCCKLRSLLNEATRDFYSRLNTATLETLTNSDEIREIISGKDLLRAQPDAPTPPSSELIRLMEARVARELRKARQQCFCSTDRPKKAPPGACLRGFSVPSFSLFPDAYTRKNLAETPKTAASFVANSGVMGLTPCSMSETRT